MWLMNILVYFGLRDQNGKRCSFVHLSRQAKISHSVSILRFSLHEYR